MQLSRLKACLDLLQTVKKRDRTTFEYIVSNTNMERAILEASLNLLVKNRLITMLKSLNNKIAYSSTERGNRVLIFFGLNDILSIRP
jgi:hypothetical protein